MTQAFEIQNRANNTLRGIISVPDGDKKVACVVNLHGFSGTMGGFRSAHVHLARRLLEENTACVRFDFYGNGESDGEFTQMTFTSLLNDAQDVCSWVRKQQWFNGTLILSGQSLGGFAAASVAPRIKPNSLVLMCPGAALWHGCKERSDGLRAKGIEYGDIGGLKFSHDFNYDLAKYSPYDDASGFEKPVLIIRGTKDELVSEDVCNEYLKIYPNARLVHIEGGDHNFGSIPARAACEDAILSFIKK